MKHFYFVADYTARFYLNVDNIMISAGSSYEPSKKWNQWHGLKMKRLFVDSGGFTLFKKNGEYPFSLHEYCKFVYSLDEQYPLELVATLDYPCEIDVKRTKYKTNKQRIEATVQNAVWCIDYDNTLPWIPVLQGFTYEEYEYCYNLYLERGINMDYLAIGSICSRKGNHLAIRNLLTKIHALTNTKLHAFGLSLTYLRDPTIANILYSSDSSAWNWGVARHCDKKDAVRTYNNKLSLILSDDPQLTLTEFD